MDVPADQPSVGAPDRRPWGPGQSLHPMSTAAVAFEPADRMSRDDYRAWAHASQADGSSG
jgi:hypothetical protein